MWFAGQVDGEGNRSQRCPALAFALLTLRRRARVGPSCLGSACSGATGSRLAKLARESLRSWAKNGDRAEGKLQSSHQLSRLSSAGHPLSCFKQGTFKPAPWQGGVVRNFRTIM